MDKKKILVVDDEPDVTDLVAYHLKAKAFHVETLNDATASIAKARSYQPDLIILDIMMPDLSGIQVCRILRADPKLAKVPIIFLTAKAEAHDRIEGLESGADDYLSKPFSPKELVLRVESILRRVAAPLEPVSTKLRVGDIQLDSDTHRVTVKGAVLDLTATEFKLLRIMMERQGRVQTREHLLLNVWNYSTEIETRTVDTHVRRLREKLGTEAGWIETIRGVGYRIADKKLPA
ncbi:Alkaline phosphatase synthesis transcriptional regulatory protein PhoP [Lacunisphaera limnophila]|uniref:Alkaline phosphatase synthesis transcriptional regulatory protein PhoP n=1 Tax=Lacunisphaera limnophila TaxID=1838286 RepID=A0A1D8ASU9_9BACT|nr:response regulator transcription factor [Lacunisphaera limnophila]AOS43978.1 Alkaline phosphatase synthesis transcriptional regulatory protein PhoP [Lacunisphaera limnophila]